MKIEVYVSLGYVGDTIKDVIEVDDDEFEGMTEEQRNELIEENYAKPWLFNKIEWSWSRKGNER